MDDYNINLYDSLYGATFKSQHSILELLILTWLYIYK